MLHINFKHLIIAILISCLFSISHAEEKAPALEKQVQDLKKEVLDLNKELFILEEDLLFPANTQFSIFLSMDIGQLFDLDLCK